MVTEILMVTVFYLSVGYIELLRASKFSDILHNFNRQVSRHWKVALISVAI